jgi:class 3 adenylate cyclase
LTRHVVGQVSSFVLVDDQPHRNIRFTKTEDGVSIAYWELGEGRPVVILNNFGFSHAELEWTVPSIASFYTDLAERYRVIRFDPRGIGLSGEPPGGWGAVTPSGGQQGMSIREMGLDISAVAAATRIDDFALLALSVQGPVAIAYATTHSEVTALILCESFAAVAQSYMTPLTKADDAMHQISTETGVRLSIWDKTVPRDEIQEVVKLIDRTMPSASMGTVGPTQADWDAESLLAEVSVPTLILNTRNKEIDTLPDSRHLAAGIVDSQLRVLNGTGVAPYYSERSATLEAIDALLNPSGGMEQAMPSGFRTVVFTDIVGSTEYVRGVGDEEGRAAVRELEQKVASLATDHNGRVVKNLGDGSLISFGSNTSAIAFGLEVQEKCSDGPLKLRVGMAAGEPIQEDGDIHGTVVAHASRIGDIGGAGEVIVSDSVRQLAAGKGFTFVPWGEVTLKGFDEPERVWKVTRP